MTDKLNPWLKQKLPEAEKRGSPLKYVIEVAPGTREAVKSQLLGLPQLSVLSQPADRFIMVSAPPEVLSRIEAIPEVVKISAETVYRIKSPIPILGFLTPLESIRLPRVFDPWQGEVSVSKVEIEVGLLEGIAKLPLRALASFEENVYTTDQVRQLLGIPKDNKIQTRVAVLDTGGIKFPHPLMHINTKVHLVSLVPGEAPLDGMSHGAWCQAAAFGDNFTHPRWGKCEGMADAYEQAHYKVLSNAGFGMTSWILDGIYKAFEWGARILSLSLGGPLEGSAIDDDPTCRLVNDLSAKGVIFVVACLEACAKILTPYGHKLVRYLKPGDKIIAYDETSNTFVEDTVILTAARYVGNLFEIKTDEGHAIRVTGEHPFFVDRNGILAWVPASELQVGDHVFSYPDLPAPEKVTFRRGHAKILNLTCLQCGGGFTAYKNSRHQPNPYRKFCCPECYHKYAVAHGLPQRGAIALRRYKRERPEDSYLSSLRGALNVRRKQGVTALELRLYAMLELLNLKFDVEFPIFEGGEFITQADAALVGQKVAFFADGRYWHKEKVHDESVDVNLSNTGWLVIRLSEQEIREDALSCLNRIQQEVGKRTVAADPVVTEIHEIKLPYRHTVYDVKTARFHTLVANGLVVHNCGNDGTDWSVGSPGAAPGAITVGSWGITRNALAGFSSRGPSGEFYRDHPDIWNRDLAKIGEDLIKPDICAFGGDDLAKEKLLSAGMPWYGPLTDPILGFSKMMGTSMACPVAAGAIALAYDRGYIKSAADVKAKLKAASAGPKSFQHGWGLLTFAKLTV